MPDAGLDGAVEIDASHVGVDAGEEPEEHPELCPRPPGAWQVETAVVPEFDDFYLWCLAASDETVIIALRDGPTLQAAVRGSDGWSTSIVDPTELAVGPTCATSPDGAVWLAYAGVDHFLRVATLHDGVWEARAVLEVSEVLFPSLAFGLDGEMHVSHYWLSGNGESALRYSRSRGVAWETTTLDDRAFVGQFSAIAVDSEGRAHVVHASSPSFEAPRELLHSVHVGDEWRSSMVFAPDDEFPAGLALGPEGAAHIVFWRNHQESAGPYHAARQGGTWLVELVDADNSILGATGQEQPLAVDVRGNVHLAYTFSEDGGHNTEVRYATNESGAWQTETIASGGVVGFALDPMGQAHVALGGLANGAYEVRHAWREAEPCP